MIQISLPTLVSRLGRLAKRANPAEEATIRAISGQSIHELASHLVTALNPEVQLEVAQRESGKTYLSVDDPEVLTTAKHLIMEAAAPFDNPDLRDALVRT